MCQMKNSKVALFITSGGYALMSVEMESEQLYWPAMKAMKIQRFCVPIGPWCNPILLSRLMCWTLIVCDTQNTSELSESSKLDSDFEWESHHVPHTGELFLKRGTVLTNYHPQLLSRSKSVVSFLGNALVRLPLIWCGKSTQFSHHITSWNASRAVTKAPLLLTRFIWRFV